MNFSSDEWVLLGSWFLIYGIFLCYDLFKRGEKYGHLAYYMALVPSNYLWHISTKQGAYEFGALGAMMVLCILWLLAVIRDIFIKDKEIGFKDADDVALMLVLSLGVQMLLTAVLPNIFEAMQGGTTTVWGLFYIPEFSSTGVACYADGMCPSNNIVYAYKLLATLLIITIIVPIVIDLKGTKVPPFVLIVITLIFLIPFAFLSFMWIGNYLLLIPLGIVFFILLLKIANDDSK
jgi:hypothetical protein